MFPLVALLETLNSHHADEAVASKLCHLVTCGHHWTPLGVAVSAVSDQLSLDSVLLVRKEETEKLCSCEYAVGCRCDTVGLLSNEELNVPEPEHVVGRIGASFSVLSGPEEEE